MDAKNEIETFWEMMEERIAKGEVCGECHEDMDECSCESCSPKDDDDECICEEDANGNIIANKNCKEHDCCKLCSKCVKCEFNGKIWWCAVCEKDNEEDDV